MQNTRYTQHELWNFNIELHAVSSLHLVAATHCADLCGQYGAAGIFETLVWLDQGLLAYHTLPAHFLYVVMGIGDNPVAADEFGGAAAKIGDGDGVGKHKTVARLVGLLRQVIYLRLNDEIMLVALFHLRHLNRFLSVSQDANVEMYRHQTEILLLASVASATGR